MKEHILKLTDIEKNYGPNRVLGPLSLIIDSGEIIGIRGENGSGKSTLIRLTAGIEKPSGGKIEKIEFAPGELGYVPQELALFPMLTGYQNLKFYAAAVGLKGRKIKTKCLELLEKTGLTGKAHAKVSTYSGGMQRRLNLACALLGEPKLLLADEPTVGADDASVESIIGIFRELSANGCAVVFVTHRRDEFQKLNCAVYLLKNGQLQKEEAQ